MAAPTHVVDVRQRRCDEDISLAIFWQDLWCRSHIAGQHRRRAVEVAAVLADVFCVAFRLESVEDWQISPESSDVQSRRGAGTGCASTQTVRTTSDR
jgi:hypothetical protein